MSIPRISHIEVLALDALVTPALLRRVLTRGGGLTRDVALRVVAAVTFLSCDWVASVTVTVAFAPERNESFRKWN